MGVGEEGKGEARPSMDLFFLLGTAKQKNTHQRHMLFVVLWWGEGWRADERGEGGDGSGRGEGAARPRMELSFVRGRRKNKALIHGICCLVLWWGGRVACGQAGGGGAMGVEGVKGEARPSMDFFVFVGGRRKKNPLIQGICSFVLWWGKGGVRKETHRHTDA